MSTMITHTIINSTMENPASRFFISRPAFFVPAFEQHLLSFYDTFLKKQLHPPLKTLQEPGGFAKFNRSTLLAKGDVGTRSTAQISKGSQLQMATQLPLEESFFLELRPADNRGLASTFRIATPDAAGRIGPIKDAGWRLLW